MATLDRVQLAVVGWLGLSSLGACSLFEPFPEIAPVPGDGSADADAANACGLALGNANDCAREFCCAEATRCAASPACSNLEVCLAGANDVQHRSNCLRDNPIHGSPDAPAALEACLAANCASTLSLACGGFAEIAPDAGGCQTCVTLNDCDSAAECATNPSCLAYYYCRRDCVTGDCVGVCDSTYGAGSPSGYGQFFGFYDGICRTACGNGFDWSCLGTVTWPPSQGSTMSVTLQIADPGGQPLAGVDVTACTDDPCATPLATGTTAADGGVTLNYTYTALDDKSGFLGHLEVTDADGGVYPTLIYWGFPITSAMATIPSSLRVLTASDWSSLLQAYAAYGVTVGPDAGAIAGYALDCFGSPAYGVAFSLDFDAGGVRTLYTDQLVPIAASATDGDGTAMILNVPAGPVSVNASPVALGGVLSATVQASVRPGWLTEVIAGPTPENQ